MPFFNVRREGVKSLSASILHLKMNRVVSGQALTNEFQTHLGFLVNFLFQDPLLPLNGGDLLFQKIHF